MQVIEELVQVVSEEGSSGGSAGPIAPPAERAQGQTPMSRQRRVLLVDDNETDRNLLKVLLEEHAEILVVGEASNGEEAEALAEQHRPDIILMDIHLPHVNGVEATRHINRRLPQVMIIGVSSLYTPHDYNAMITAGAVAFVRKEDAVEALYKTIEFSTRTFYSSRRAALSHNASRRSN